jgi:hypothetical protein
VRGLDRTTTRMRASPIPTFVVALRGVGYT